MALQPVNPYTLEPLEPLPWHSGDEVEAVLRQAQSAFQAWRRVPLEQRIREVLSALARFEASGESIARDITLQMGKPIAQARREVATCLERGRVMAELAPAALAPEILPELPGLHRAILREPQGVVLDIAAWNYPLLLSVNVLVPALLAGNAVLLKPSARTPRCGAAFEAAFAGILPGLVTSLRLDHARTGALVQDSRVAHVVFTGSVAGGREIQRQAAARFMDLTLELGGKDPAYVAEDADLPFAAENIVDGACYNAGQSCCAVERAYVHRSRYDEFLALARTHLEAYRMGDPMDEATTLGPLASTAALDLLEAQVADAVARGARLLLGGRRMNGNFFPPTLLADVPQEARVMQEESFGPILPVRAVSGDAEALRLMNDSPYGLTASVWTRDPARAEAMAQDLDAGTVYCNRCDYLDPRLPWSGRKDSGRGLSLSAYGFHALTRTKGLNFKT